MTIKDPTVEPFEATKDPSEILDYTIDYASIFEATEPTDDIQTSVWATSNCAGETLTIIEDDFTAPNLTTVWVSGGGKLGTVHKLVNTVATWGGRTYERTIRVTMQNK